ncbi:FmdB family zinc ribbon protein [Thermovibrio sp.]
MEVIPKRKFECLDCGEQFEEPFGKPRWMVKCPKCGSENVVRVNASDCRGGRGWGWRCRQGRGWGWKERQGRGWKRGRCRW